MKHQPTRFIALFTAVIMLLCAVPVTASAVAFPRSVGGFVYTLDGDTATLSTYTGSDTVIAVPAVIDGYTVTSLNLTFQGNSKVTDISLPASVTHITPITFECDNLKSITVAEDNPAFTSLDGVLYSKDMKTLVAYPCGGKTDFTVPIQVEHIGDYAFFRCYKLVSVVMNNNVTTIGDNAFAFCWNLRSVRLSDNLTSIDGEAFLSCGWLTTMTLPVNVTSIGKDALLGFLGSDGAPRYNFINGVYCVKNSFADRYLGSIRITSVRKYIPDSRFDPLTGITVQKEFGKGTRVDMKALTSGADFDIIEALRNADSSLLTSAVYSVTAESSGETAEFSDITVSVPLPAGFSPSITRIYVVRDGALSPLTAKAGSYVNNRQSLSFTLPETGAFAVIEKFTFTVPGDVDGDGEVTTTDARLTLRAAAQLDTLSSAQLPAADVDGASGISTTDARRILRVAARLETI